MGKGWRTAAGFRADPGAASATSAPSRRQAVALVAALVLLTGAIAAASYLVTPERSRAFDVLNGSLYLANANGPVAVDLATGQPTVRLLAADSQVGAKTDDQLAVVPLAQETLLLNRANGEFNMVDATGFVIKTQDGGVGLPPSAASSGRAMGIADGDSAFVVQSGPGPDTSVYLVNAGTVQTAAGAVDAAAGERKPPEPKAFAAIKDQVVGADAARSANGHLWLLTTAVGGGHQILDLPVPDSSRLGLRLRPVGRGAVGGAAALATAQADDGTTSVGVASSDRLIVHLADGTTRVDRFAQVPGLQAVKPATNSPRRLAFLLRGATGWSVLSARPDGTDLRGPTPLTGIEPGADLVSPGAAADGTLYTIDRNSGRLWTVTPAGSAQPLAGHPFYPLEQVEAGQDYTGAYVVARGSRVILNAPGYNQAVVVFTDGSRPPLVIRKGSAVAVNAAGGAQALAQSRIDHQADVSTGQQKPQRHPKPAQAANPINNEILCAGTTQVPHVPVVTGTVPGSQSVQLSWTYPTVGREDCLPSLYQVQVTPTGDSNAPTLAPVSVTYAMSVVIAGLKPDTQYTATVTAIINERGTDSKPAPFRTGPQGPTAPTGVTAAPDANGGWSVAWSSCGEFSSTCLPSTTWTVVPTICNPQGIGTAPAPFSVAADPTSTVQPGGHLAGGDALLGQSLSFRVQGVGASGELGALSAPTPCTTSWRPPTPGAMTLTASTNRSAPTGQTVPVSATLDLGAAATHNAGGVGASVVFVLTGNGQTQTSAPLVYTGATSRLTSTFGSIAPGLPYAVSALVTPPGQPSAAVSLVPVTVSTASDWPTPAVQASCAQSLLSCDLSVRITNISSAQANGELFSLADTSEVRCGNVTQSLNASSFDPATFTITTTLSQLSGFYGTCNVTIALVESTSSSTPYFGGLTSPQGTTAVDLGSKSTANIQSGDFTVSWNSTNGSSVQVHYTGSLSPSDESALTTNWSETVTGPDPDRAACGSAAQQPDQNNDVVFTVSGQCVQTYGGTSANWTVTVSYDNAVDHSPGGTFTYQLAGPPPGYQKCAPDTGSLAATWGATRADPVSVTYGGDTALIAGCSGWAYELDDSTGTTCTPADPNVTGPPPVTVPISCATPADNSWTVKVSWHDDLGNVQTTSVAVTGPPPTA